MSKVLVLGASGKSGSLITKELLDRGHEVIAVVRDPAKIHISNPKLHIIKGSVEDDLKHHMTGVAAVVNALAPPFDSVGLVVTWNHKLIEDIKATTDHPRYLMVGGAGGLSTGETGLVIDQPWFPAEWKGIAQAHIDALNDLKKSSISWTTLSPPAFFEPGQRTGKFRLGTEELIFDVAAGKSWISMEDYAIAFVDEIEHPAHVKTRFTIGY